VIVVIGAGSIGQAIARRLSAGKHVLLADLRQPNADAAAKVLSDFAKENDQRPAVKGGLLDGAVIDQAQVKKLASMPSREQMLAELGAGLQSPMAAFVGALSGMMYMMVGALEALRTQKESASA